MNEPTCRETVDALMDYLEGRLPLDHQRMLDEHFAQCPSCVEFLRSYRATPRIVRRGTETDVPDEVSRRLKLVLGIA